MKILLQVLNYLMYKKLVKRDIRRANLIHNDFFNAIEITVGGWRSSLRYIKFLGNLYITNDWRTYYDIGKGYNRNKTIEELMSNDRQFNEFLNNLNYTGYKQLSL